MPMSAPGGDEPTPGRVGILVVVCAAIFISVLNASIVNVVLPTIGADLDVDAALLGWVITVYSLVYAVAIPFYGRLADLYGARGFFLFGQGVFALGSLLCALAPSFPLLLVARVIQASGGAAVPGLGIALAARAFPPHQRGTVLGIVTTALGVAAAIGPTSGGLLADRFGWHAVFVVGALAGLLVPASWLLLPPEKPRGGERLDVWGGLFLAVGISGGLYALTEGSRVGWGSPRPLGSAAVALVGLAALVIRQRWAATPFIPRELLANRRYVALVTTSFGAMTAMMGAFVGLPLLLAGVNELSPAQVGLVLLPNAALTASLGVVVGRLVDRVGARWPVRVGLVVMMAAALGLSSAAGSSAWTVAVILMLLGLGSSLVNTPLSAAVSLVVRPERLASGQSMNTMLFFLGGSFGATLTTAVVGARAGAADALNPLHGGAGVGFSDAFLLALVPLLLALSLSGAVPSRPPSGAREESIRRERPGTVASRAGTRS
ncbi:MAG: MFS transporter [Chloroflexota bacterium]|nr:MFS transporter [Chloroflexota bacterium]